MGFEVGQKIVYGNDGICIIEGFEKRSFNETDAIEYFKLVPVDSKTSAYFVPNNEMADKKMRELMTKEEVLALIDEMPDIKQDWLDNKNERRVMFNSILKSDDYRQLIGMIKSICLNKEEKESIGKTLTASDDKAMKKAEEIMYKEFATVLEIPYEDVQQYVNDRISV